jgi:hypothetical protein
MPNLFIWLRYLVFALCVVCSAVICSVSVWNLGFAQGSPSLAQIIQVDSYVIFAGGAGLVLVFTIIFIEVGRNRNASLTSRVWFECLWSGFLFMLNLSAAALVTALIPSQMCQSHHLPVLACTSSKILQAFTWLLSIITFTYFLTIFITVFIRSGSDSRMWQGSIFSISFYDRSNSSTRLQSPPASPTPGRMLGKITAPTIAAPTIAAPRPRKPVHMPYAYRSGLSPEEYQIEHFQFPGPQRPPPVRSFDQPSSNLSFYPEFLRASLRSSMIPNVTQVAPTSILNFDSSALPNDIVNSPQGTAAPRTSPPPLGDWPRADIMAHTPQVRPTKSSRRTTKIFTASPDIQQSEPSTLLAPPMSMASEGRNIGPSVPVSLGSRTLRPSGPRTRIRAGSVPDANSSADANRPPPLDLSSISALKPNR